VEEEEEEEEEAAMAIEAAIAHCLFTRAESPLFMGNPDFEGFVVAAVAVAAAEASPRSAAAVESL